MFRYRAVYIYQLSSIVSNLFGLAFLKTHMLKISIFLHPVAVSNLILNTHSRFKSNHRNTSQLWRYSCCFYHGLNLQPLIEMHLTNPSAVSAQIQLTINYLKLMSFPPFATSYCPTDGTEFAEHRTHQLDFGSRFNHHYHHDCPSPPPKVC